MQLTVRTFGEGGYNPDAPDGNLVGTETFDVPDTADASTLDDVRAQLTKVELPDAIRTSLDGVLAAVADHLAATADPSAADAGQSPGLLGRILGRN